MLHSIIRIKKRTTKRSSPNMKITFPSNAIRKVSALALALLTASASLTVFAEGELPLAQIYVSTEGDDSAAGTESAPLATLEAARDAVRALSREQYSGAQVIIRGGEYRRDTTFKLTAEDGGSDGFSVSYVAYEDETPVFTGAATLNPEKFTEPDEAFRSLLPEESKDKVLAYDLAADGLDYARYERTGIHNAILPDNRIYVGDVRCTQARYPNLNRSNSISNYVYATKTSNNESEGYYSFYDESGRAASWSEESRKNARMNGFFPIDWIQSSADIVGIDEETGYVVYTPTNGDYGKVIQNSRYAFYNVPEELDAPMEYYINRDTGMLYIYLPDGWQESGVTIGQSLCTRMLESTASNITFSGLTFRGTMLDAMKLTGDDITVSGCRILCIGKNAIDAKGKRILIDSCEVYNVGGNGIRIGVDKEVRRANIFTDSQVSNCKIHAFEELDRIYNPGLSLQGLGSRALNNEIYDAPHLGMSYVGTNIEIAYNIFENLCYDSSDAGALYIYDATITSGGTKIHDNIVRNIINDENIYFNPHGIYLDAGSGGMQVYSNILENVDGFGILSGGPDNELCDNLFINSVYQFHGGNYYKVQNEHTGWNGLLEDGTGNIGTYPNGMFWQFLLSDKENPGNGTERWAYLNPWVMLLKTTNCYDLNDNYVAYAYGDARVRNNVFSSSSKSNDVSNAAARLIVIRDNFDLTLSQISLADLENRDYRLTDDTMIYQVIPGFRYCNVERVGIGK